MKLSKKKKPHHYLCLAYLLSTVPRPDMSTCSFAVRRQEAAVQWSTSCRPMRRCAAWTLEEASTEVEKLLLAQAMAGAARHWRAMRCSDTERAQGWLAWMLHRRWALPALRENARLKLERLEYVSHGAAAAAQRRGVIAVPARMRAADVNVGHAQCR